MLYLSLAALGLTFYSLNAAAVPLASPEAIASLVANLPPEDHAADLASLMARGNDEPSPLNHSPLAEQRQLNSSSLMTAVTNGSNSSMSAIIDSYIVNLQQAGYVPNANATISKRDTLSLDSLVEKRSVPSVPLVIALLGQHGFVPSTSGTDGTPTASSKRTVPDLAESAALQKRTLPDIDLVVARLAAHGFVPTGGGSNASVVAKRDATGDINTVISQLEAFGFNPGDFMQGSGNSSAAAAVNASTISKRNSHWALK